MGLLDRQDSLHPGGSCLLPTYRGALGPQLFLGLLHREDPHHSMLKKIREQAVCGAAIIVMMPFLFSPHHLGIKTTKERGKSSGLGAMLLQLRATRLLCQMST